MSDSSRQSNDNNAINTALLSSANMARSPNRSQQQQITISLPPQTYAYLLMLASAGALGASESAIAAQIVIKEVELLMSRKRAETDVTKDVWDHRGDGVKSE
jgi:hypothetical protein